MQLNRSQNPSFFSRKARRQILDDPSLILQSSSAVQTDGIGHMLGSIVLQMFKEGHPVYGFYLYGFVGDGKSVLLKGMVNSFEDGEGFKGWRRHDHYPKPTETYPSALHRDIWRASMMNGLRPAIPKDDEVLFVEWADLLPYDWMERDRIMIEFRQNEAETRTISFLGFGNGASAVQMLKEKAQ